MASKFAVFVDGFGIMAHFLRCAGYPNFINDHINPVLSVLLVRVLHVLHTHRTETNYPTRL